MYRVGTIGWQLVHHRCLGINSSFPIPLLRQTRSRRRGGAKGGGGAGEGRRATSFHDSMLETSGLRGAGRRKEEEGSRTPHTNTVCNKKGTDNIIKLTEVQGIVRISL